MPRPIPGDIVRHVLSDAPAQVVTVEPVHDCGEYGTGNWLNGTFMAQPVLTVRHPIGPKTTRGFACFYHPATPHDIDTFLALRSSPLVDRLCNLSLATFDNPEDR